MPPSISTVDHNLCFAVYSTAHAFNRVYKPLLATLGLTYPQYLVMLVLWERDGLSIKTISDRLMLDSGTLTPLVKRLEMMGLVLRARSNEDERQVLVTLTPAGNALRLTAVPIPSAVGCATGLDLAGLDVLMSALLGLRARLLDAAAEH